MEITPPERPKNKEYMEQICQDMIIESGQGMIKTDYILGRKQGWNTLRASESVTD